LKESPKLLPLSTFIYSFRPTLKVSKACSLTSSKEILLKFRFNPKVALFEYSGKSLGFPFSISSKV